MESMKDRIVKALEGELRGLVSSGAIQNVFELDSSGLVEDQEGVVSGSVNIKYCPIVPLKSITFSLSAPEGTEG